MKKRIQTFIFHKTWQCGLIILLCTSICEFIWEPQKVYANTSLELTDYLSVNVTALVIICLFIITFYYNLRTKKISERRVSEAFQELRYITNSIHAGFITFDLERNYEIAYASNGYYDMIGYDKSEIRIEFNNSFLPLILEEDVPKIKILSDEFALGKFVQTEIRYITKQGQMIWLLLNGNYIMSEDGEKSLSVVLVDVTNSKIMQEKLLMEEERYRVAAEISNDILFEYDIKEDIMIFAEKYKELYGRNSKIYRFLYGYEYEGNMIHPEDVESFMEFCKGLESGRDFIEAEFRIKDISGEFVWCHTKGKTIYDDEKHATRVIGKIVNIDLHKKELQTLEYKAKRDSLTGVYNKITTKDLIDHYIQKNSDASHVFMIIDIDDFKNINDTYGHLQGDKILTHVIEQVKSIFTTGEIIGRIGGDEFVVFLGNISSRETVTIKADLLRRCLRSSYKEDDHEISISGSIGISMYPDDGDNYNELLICADKALYTVKDQGKDGYKLFT